MLCTMEMHSLCGGRWQTGCYTAVGVAWTAFGQMPTTTSPSTDSRSGEGGIKLLEAGLAGRWKSLLSSCMAWGVGNFMYWGCGFLRDAHKGHKRLWPTVPGVPTAATSALQEPGPSCETWDFTSDLPFHTQLIYGLSSAWQDRRGRCVRAAGCSRLTAVN